MYTLSKTLSLPLALFALLALAACDQGEQTYDIAPGDSLIGLRGPGDVAVPQGEATFNIVPFTVEKSYEWSVEGPGDVETTLRRDGEYLDITLDEPGTYTVTINDGEYSGETTFEAAYTDVASQANRLFGSLGAGLEEAELLDTLGTDGPFTLFAPTNAAVASALGTNDDDEPILPASNVLADILSYHVVSDSLPAAELDDPEETLEGSELMFDMSGDDVLVIDGTEATDAATVTNANIPAGNGLIHEIDALLLPPTASVALNDQTTEDNVTVTVRSVYIPQDGYVAIHESTQDGEVPGSVIGVSEYLEAGLQNDVEVTLFDVPGGDFDDGMMLDSDQLLIAMPHQETNGNMEYNFLTSGRNEDGAYIKDGEAVIDSGTVTVSDLSDE